MRDSVAPPPMSEEQIKAAFETLKLSDEQVGVIMNKANQKYNPIIEDKETYKSIKRRYEKLLDLREKASWLVKRTEWELSGEEDRSGIEKILKTVYKVRQHCAWIEYELDAYQKKEGENVMKRFSSLTLEQVFNRQTQKVDTTLLAEIKENIFFSKKPYNVNCGASGIGGILKKLQKKDLNPKSACTGYVVSLGNDFNLMILKVLDKKEYKIITIILDKNIESSTYGPIYVF